VNIFSSQGRRILFLHMTDTFIENRHWFYLYCSFSVYVNNSYWFTYSFNQIYFYFVDMEWWYFFHILLQHFCSVYFLLYSIFLQIFKFFNIHLRLILPLSFASQCEIRLTLKIFFLVLLNIIVHAAHYERISNHIYRICSYCWIRKENILTL